MFGGIAFLHHGNMFVGIVGDDLMVRVGPAQHETALTRPHARPMDFAGRPMKGYVYVAPEGIDADDTLAGWVRLALEFVSTLPPKGPAPARAPKRATAAKGPTPKTTPAFEASTAPKARAAHKAKPASEAKRTSRSK